MQIETIVVSPFETNCYLVWDEKGKDGVIIDPGDEDEKILGRVDKNGLRIRAILLTHGHIDHIAAVEPIKNKLGIPLYIGRGDEIMLSSPSANASAFFGFPVTCPPADHIIGDNDIVKAGSRYF
ncbi:MAG: MBL fold metallo-hydrolase [Candidatus Zixiibacteriota bacterium]